MAATSKQSLNQNSKISAVIRIDAQVVERREEKHHGAASDVHLSTDPPASTHSETKLPMRRNCTAATSQLLCSPLPQQQASGTPQRLEHLGSRCRNSRPRTPQRLEHLGSRCRNSRPWTPQRLCVCKLPLPQQLAQERRNVWTCTECRCRNSQHAYPSKSTGPAPNTPAVPEDESLCHTSSKPSVVST